MDKTSIELANAIKNKEAAEVFLKQLEEYRHDYSLSINALMREGCPALTLSYYRDFLTSLDHALDQARSAVENESSQIDTAQAQWKDQKMDLTSYETLISRKQQSHELKTRRTEQKLLDEMASRRLSNSFSFNF